MRYRCEDCGYKYLLDCFCEGDKHMETLIKETPLIGECEGTRRRRRHLEVRKRMKMQKYR